MKNYKSNPILTLVLVICSFTINAQSRITHIDLNEHMITLPSYSEYVEEKERISKKHLDDFHDANTSYKESEEIKHKHDSLQEALTNDFINELKEHLVKVAKSKNIDYLIVNPNYVVNNIDPNNLFNYSKTNHKTIGHIDLDSYSRSLPIYQSHLEEMEVIQEDFQKVSSQIDSIRNIETSDYDNSERNKLINIYDELEKKAELLYKKNEEVLNNYRLKSFESAHSLANKNGFTYIFDTDIFNIIIINGNNIQNGPAKNQDIKIAYVDENILFQNTTTITKKYEQILENNVIKEEGFGEYLIDEKEFEKAREKLFMNVRSIIAQVGAQKGMDYVFLVSNEVVNDILAIKGNDITKEVQAEIENKF